MRRLALVLIAGSLASCDVGVAAGAFFLSKKSSDGGGDAPGPPDLAYHVWIATLATPADAVAEESVLIAAGGTPSAPVWTRVGSGTASAVFVPPVAGNAVLVEAPSELAYHLDAVETMDAVETVLEMASAPTYSSQVLLPANATGLGDGLTADTAALPGSRAFFFTRFAAPFSRVRINVWSAAQAPGDVVWSLSIASAGNERAGGMAVDAAGVAHLTVSDVTGATRNIVLHTVNAAGTLTGSTTLFPGIPDVGGSHSIALDGAGNVHVAVTGGTSGNTDILVRKYTPALSQIWEHIYDSGFNGDQVEPNSLAVDGAGDVLVAGASQLSILLLVGSHHFLRKLASATGATVWTQTLGSNDSASSYWFAVRAGPGNDVFSAGDLTSLATASIETVTRRSTAAGGATWSDQTGDNQAPSDRANAIALDSSGNVIVGGYFGRSATGRDAIVARLTAAGSPVSVLTFDGPAGGDDEVLAVAADADGTAYAVGSETVSGQGKNWILRKISPLGVLLWTRTIDGGFGDDVAAGVAIDGPHIVVAGTLTLSGGTTDVHVRRYVK